MTQKKNDFPGFEQRGDETRVTVYGKGHQKKVFFKQNLSSNELLNSIYAAKIIIEGLWRQDLIHKDDITVEMFKLVIQGQTVNASQPQKQKETPLIKILLKDKLDQYFKMIDNKSFSDNKIKQSTYKSYKNYIDNSLIPAFGDHKLNELNKLMLVEWVNTLKITFKYFRNLIIPLKSVYLDACALRVINKESNIFDDNYIVEYAAKILPSGERKPEPFSGNEISIFYDQEKSYLKNLLIFGIYTGLRVGELINLKISDISLKNGVIYVSSQFSSGEEMAPKTKKGIRQVTILARAGAAILEQLELCRLYNQTEYLFFNPNTGKRWSSSTKLNKHLKKYYEHVNSSLNIGTPKIKYRGFHQCRHTYASMLVATENLWWVASQMGHETIELLINVYGDWIPNDKLSNQYQFRNSDLIK